MSTVESDQQLIDPARFRLRDLHLPRDTHVFVCPAEAAASLRTDRLHPSDATGARGLLLALLSAEFSVPVEDIVWHRPHFAATRSGGHRLFTSLSRTAGCIAVAISARPIGLDIERLQTATQAGDLMEVIHPRDRAAAAGTAGTAQRKLVTMMWTRIEAVLKLRGTGLNSDPATVRVGPGPGPLLGRRTQIVSTLWTDAAPATDPEDAQCPQPTPFAVSAAWHRFPQLRIRQGLVR